MRIGSVLLAAGGGSRYRASLGDATQQVADTHKLLALGPDGRSVVEHAFDAMAYGSLDSPLIVVSGAVELPEFANASMVHNPRWAEGQSTSLRVALEVGDALGFDAVVVGLGDQPRILPSDWTRVRNAMASGASIAVATYDGRRRNPVGLARSVWPLLPIASDEGFRSVMGAHPHLVTEVPCTGNPDDIDSVEDLLQWHLS